MRKFGSEAHRPSDGGAGLFPNITGQTSFSGSSKAETRSRHWACYLMLKARGRRPKTYDWRGLGFPENQPTATPVM